MGTAQFEKNRQNVFHGSWSFFFLDTDIADGDIVTQFTPGFPGSIVNVYWVQGKAFSTGAKDSTLNVEIGAVNTVGGAVEVDSDTLTTMGMVSNGTVITGSNNFDADDTISIEASSTTAFVDSVYGTLVIEYEGKIIH